MENKQIYSAICGVMNDVGAVGKNSKNTQQNFMFRGIDAVMNALSPALIKNKVFVVPEVTNEERTERTNSKGNVLFYTRLSVTYRFYTVDGSYVEAKVIGEAMDTGDKATNKAMSIAYKYACFQVFNIPTEEMKDPDAECHDVAPQNPDAGWHDIAPQDPVVLYADENKIKVLKETMAKKGVTDKQILDRYKITNFEQLTVEHFIRAMKSLEKTSDVESKQVDLGL